MNREQRSAGNCSSRRRFLQGCAASVGAFALPGVIVRTSQPPAPAVKIHERRVISQQPHLYHGWPTVARQRSGKLLLVYSGGREAHVCPFGRVELMRSHDEGQSWTWPEVLLDSPIDDRDSGVLETAADSILVTSFTSLAYESILARAEKAKGAWQPERLQRWQAAHSRVGPEQRKAALGQWMIRSTDGGLTWSGRYSSIVNSPHGPVQLADRRIMYAGKELWTGKQRCGVCVSTDDGRSWRWLAELPTRPGDSPSNYHELHCVETPSGTLIIQIRNHNKANRGETLQAESSDGGRTWSTPHPIGVWGLPSHLLRLADGRLLMSYGYRRPPYGNQARISEDEGKSWSEPITISDDGASGDLGYPSTVQLSDGSLLTVWYELPKGSTRAVLRQCHWSLA